VGWRQARRVGGAEVRALNLAAAESKGPFSRIARSEKGSAL